MIKEYNDRDDGNTLIDSSLYTPDYILDKALDIGESILKCGGEAHRIEDTVVRICSAYGAEKTDVFALPSLIIAGIRMSDGRTASHVRRVYKTTNNMYKLDEMNAISRDVCSGKITLEDIDDRLKKISTSVPYSKVLSVIGGMVAAGGFAVFFGGNFYDAIAAAIAGFFVSLMNIPKLNLVNKMLYTIAQAFVGAICGLILVHFGVGSNIDMIMIGTIMLMIPGLAFGNAVRDLLFGDTVSGIMQLVQAALTAVMIAFGYIVAILFFGGVIK